MTAVINAYTLSECMEIMAEYAAAYEASGGRNLIFCEDRLTLIAERALVKKMGGTLFSSVTTFARYLKKSGGACGDAVLSKQGSVMAVGEIMTRLQRENKLKCFTSAAGIENNAKAIYETIAQLAASRVTPESLTDSLERLSDDDGAGNAGGAGDAENAVGSISARDGILKDKISDLAAIYGEYSAFLREKGYVDESRYLSLLPSRIRGDKTLAGGNIFFLCYTSFTAQAAEAIRAATERVGTGGNVIGIFCGGEEEIYTNRASALFTRVCEETGKVRVLNKGLPLEGEAELLRKGLFNPEIFGENEKGGDKNNRCRTDKIRFFEGENVNAEAEYIAVNIRKCMQEMPDLRYRDIAVLVSDTKNYLLPIKKAFDEYHIAYFFDERRSLKQHPLGKFLLDCFAVVREGFSPTAVQSLTANVFFGEADEYRNYLLKYANYRGGAKRAIKESELIVSRYDIEALEECRERLISATENIKRRGQGFDYCRAVRKILVDFNAEETLKILSEKIGDIALKSYLLQISSSLDKVLGEAEALTGSRELTCAEFETILSDGLDTAEISLIPMKTDAVFVGDIADSRIEKVRVLFAAGMTDSVPRSSGDTALVSDREIERLAEVKTLIEPTVAEVNLRNRESVALNLCTFTDRLFLSYPLAADGSDPALSEVFRYADGLFMTGRGYRLQTEKKLPEEDFCYRCSAAVPAIRALLAEKNEFENFRGDTREKFSSLYEAMRRLNVSECEEYFEKQWGQVRVQWGKELFFKDGQISPTALESYFNCPFGNYARKGLGLKEREETIVLATDSGNFIHEVLNRVAPKLACFSTEEEACEYAEETGRILMQSPVFTAQADTAAGGYSMKSLLKESNAVVGAVYRQIKGSAYKVEATEKTVATPFFRGKVDRIDGTDKYVRVIDYKTGRIEDDAVAYYTGRRLQLELYMTAVAGERIPAGVFYFPASLSYSADGEGRFRMSGFLNGDPDALLCGDLSFSDPEKDPKAKSEFFEARSAPKENARLKKVMDGQTFSDFLEYSVYEAMQGSSELENGFIAPSPYAGACEYCRFGGMCGFNRDIAAERKEKAIAPKEIAEISRRCREKRQDEGDEEEDEEGLEENFENGGIGEDE